MSQKPESPSERSSAADAGDVDSAHLPTRDQHEKPHGSVAAIETTSTAQEGSYPVDYAGAYEKFDPKEIALVRKLDWHLMPVLWIMYFLNYLDRNAIALARLDHLENDLGLTDRQYETCISVLFVGYIIGQIPSNMILTRVRPSWWLSGFMALWGLASASSALTHNYTGMVLARFFLGVTEAPFTPGALYMLSNFYNRKENATRMSIMYSGNILANAFAGLIAVGVFNSLGGAAGIAGWRWFFILIGVVTFAAAILSAFILPDDPLTTRWLTSEERQLAHDRIVRDTVDHSGPQTTWKGLLDTVKDKNVWMFLIMDHLHVAATGFKNFFPTAVQTLGFSRTITLVLTCPPYLVAGLIAIYWSWQSCRYNEKTYHIIAAKLFAAFGFVLAAASLNTGARYFAMIVFSIGTYCCNALIYSWLASSCGQTKEKKASAMAFVNAFANVGFIWTPYLWPKSDGPRYAVALGSCAGFSVLGAVTAFIIKMLLLRLNKKAHRAGDETFLAYAY